MFIIEIDKIETGSDVKHDKTSWQISLTPGFEDDNIVFESLEDSDNLTKIRVSLSLDDEDLYYSRTKIHFSDGDESDWSKPNVITKHATGFNFNDTIVVTPKISVDFDTRSTPLGGFNVKATEFKLFSGIGKHKFTTWIIEDDRGNQVWSRNNDRYNLISIRIPNNILMPGKMYTIKVMYVSDTNAYSNYGRLRVITNSDLVRDPAYLNKLGITDLKAFETNTALRKMLYEMTNVNDLMEKLVKANLLVGLQNNEIGNMKEELDATKKELAKASVLVGALEDKLNKCNKDLNDCENNN